MKKTCCDIFELVYVVFITISSFSLSYLVSPTFFVKELWIFIWAERKSTF